MASNNLAGYNDLVECPYNKAHQIMRSRLQFHLVRCRRSHPNSEKVTCPFNTTHIMNKEELDVSTVINFRYFAMCSYRRIIAVAH